MNRISTTLGRTGLLGSAAVALWAVLPATEAQAREGVINRAVEMCHQDHGRLNVTGQGEARTAPDMASVQVGVTTQADSASEAMSQNSAQQSAVIDALKAAGIDSKDVQTSGLNLSPMMDYGENRAPTVTGYQARNMVTVRVSDLARLGAVLDSIVSAGANEINGISFDRADGREAEDDARRAAVADAIHKAEILADAAGLKVGQVLQMQDNVTSGGGPRPMMMRAEAGMSRDVPVEAGEVAIGAQVQMEFALIDEATCPNVPHRDRSRHQDEDAGSDDEAATEQGE